MELRLCFEPLNVVSSPRSFVDCQRGVIIIGLFFKLLGGSAVLWVASDRCRDPFPSML